MKTIDVISQRSRGLATVFSDGIAVRLEYPKWYSLVGMVTIGESRYGIVPKGFWKSRYEIIKDNKLLMTVNYSWNGCTIVKHNDEARPLAIKHRGLFKGGYVLVNYKDEVLCEVQSDFSWKKFTQDYTLNCADNFGDEETDKVLAMFTVYYIIAMQTAAASGY